LHDFRDQLHVSFFPESKKQFLEAVDFKMEELHPMDHFDRCFDVVVDFLDN